MSISTEKRYFSPYFIIVKRFWNLLLLAILLRDTVLICYACLNVLFWLLKTHLRIDEPLKPRVGIDEPLKTCFEKGIKKALNLILIKSFSYISLRIFYFISPMKMNFPFFVSFNLKVNTIYICLIKSNVMIVNPRIWLNITKYTIRLFYMDLVFETRERRGICSHWVLMFQSSMFRAFQSNILRYCKIYEYHMLTDSEHFQGVLFYLQWHYPKYYVSSLTRSSKYNGNFTKWARK